MNSIEDVAGGPTLVTCPAFASALSAALEAAGETDCAGVALDLVAELGLSGAAFVPVTD